MKRILPLGLIAAGILLILGTAGWFFLRNPAAQPVAVDIPDSIAGLEATNISTGAQAIAEFENLHGKQFPVTSGVIGIYGQNQITLWAAGAPSESIASQMVISMRDKIAMGNSPFTPMAEIEDDNRTVYVLEGMGQKHFYFQSG